MSSRSPWFRYYAKEGKLKGPLSTDSIEWLANRERGRLDDTHLEDIPYDAPFTIRHNGMPMIRYTGE